MQFESFSEFLAMGGYGFYVWLSIAVCFLCMVALVVVSKYETRRLTVAIKREAARKERVRNAHYAKHAEANQSGTSYESS